MNIGAGFVDEHGSDVELDALSLAEEGLDHQRERELFCREYS